MLNLSDRVTVTQTAASGVDPDTGNPVTGTTTVVDGARCAFRVLSARDHVQAWGEQTATQTNAVTASLILPSYTVTLTDALDTYRIAVFGYSGQWSVIAARPGEQWTSYLLTLL